jgi:predicted SAM-dependent methyltransferase
VFNNTITDFINRAISKTRSLFLLTIEQKTDCKDGKSEKLKDLIITQLKNNNCKIVLGSGGISEKGWIPTDIDVLNILKPENWEHYFHHNPNSINAILAEHVWEHLTKDEAIHAAKMCYKYLSTGGYLRVAVPDGYNPSKVYIDRVKPGGSGIGSDDHKILFTYKMLKEVFESAGFQVTLLEYFDENGEFHFTDWDPADGMVIRSKRFDPRNKNDELNYTSIIIDAHK